MVYCAAIFLAVSLVVIAIILGPRVPLAAAYCGLVTCRLSSDHR